MNEPWYTKRELASELKVSTRTIERLKLPCLKVGKQNRYRMSQVERALGESVDSRDNVIPLHRSRGAA